MKQSFNPWPVSHWLLVVDLKWCFCCPQVNHNDFVTEQDTSCRPPFIRLVCSCRVKYRMQANKWLHLNSVCVTGRKVNTCRQANAWIYTYTCLCLFFSVCLHFHLMEGEVGGGGGGWGSGWKLQYILMFLCMWLPGNTRMRIFTVNKKWHELGVLEVKQ